jgi:hypothetical protein
MPSIYIRTVLLALLLTPTLSPAQDTIRLTDLGYKPESRENATGYVNKALELCKTKAHPVLVFPKGRYDFWPQYAAEKAYFESNTDVISARRCPILIQDQHGLTLEGSDAEFVYHDRMQPITIDSSTDITIKNVNIDWDVPLTAQAEVLAVTNTYMDLGINTRESPYAIEHGKLVFLGEGWKSAWWDAMEFDRHTHLIVPNTGDASCLGGDFSGYTAEELSYGKVRLNFSFKRKPAVGNMLVMRHSARDHAGIFVVNSKNVVFNSVNIYHTAGLGILSQYSENLTFKAVQCIPNPAKNRWFCGHDDGLHFSNCKGKIEVDGCKFLALMDDPINVHGTSVKIIEKVNANTLRCQFMHPQSIGFVWAQKGDQIGIIENEAMNTFAKSTVESFRLIDPEHFEISFRDPLPASLEKGDALENLTWTPDVWIHDSFFGSNRARGILVTTPGKVVIERNIFESSGSAILIAGDANEWYESGAVTDVLIRDNEFRDPCMTSPYQFSEGIISIYPEVPKLNYKTPFHRNIRIEHNTFHPFDFPVLYAKSVEGLSFTNNTLTRSTRFTPTHARKHMLTLEACSKVTISGNKLEGDILGKDLVLLGTPDKEVKVEKGQGIAVSQN